LKALSRERDMLAKQLQKKYTKTERERLYQKWGIPLDTKQRSLQLARRLWTDVRDMRHIEDSATLVAKLAGIVEPRHAPKEMFGLSFSTNQKPPSWRDNMSSLL
jgi:centromeric protein E